MAGTLLCNDRQPPSTLHLNMSLTPSLPTHGARQRGGTFSKLREREALVTLAGTCHTEGPAWLASEGERGGGRRSGACAGVPGRQE